MVSPSTDAVAGDFLAAARAVQRYLRFLGCAREELSDLAQDVLLAGLVRWPQSAAPVPWLLGTARNLFRRHLRDRQRRRELLDLDRLERAWARNVEDGSVESRRAALQRCLAALPERSRRVLEWRYGDGLERSSIAERTGLGSEGIKTLLARTRAQLAECVGRRLRAEERT